MWYVIQVRTGMEEDVKLQCEKVVDTDVLQRCFIPYYKYMKKYLGEWHIKDNFVCIYEGESKVFSSKEEFEQSDMEKNCSVSSISVQDGVIVLELKKWVSNTPEMDDEWVREHEKQFGKSPVFF